MVPVIRVQKPGLLTTIQDTGRLGFRHLGVPVSGAVDLWALRAANALTGSPPDSACLELTLTGPALEFLQDSIVAITGADLSPTLGGNPVPMWESFYCRQGETLCFGGRKNGCRAYLAVSGGIAAPAVLGSRSTLMSAGFGGLDGRALRAGDILETAAPPAVEWDTVGLRLPDRLCPVYTNEITVKVIKGINSELFTDREFARFLARPYTVTSRLDRMGCFLEGSAIRAEAQAVDESVPVVPGSIQVLPNDNPVILLNDAQSTGGYPQIAAVITCDVWKLGQAYTGDKIFFTETDTQTAQELLKLRNRDLDYLEQTAAVKFFHQTTKQDYEVSIEKSKRLK